MATTIHFPDRNFADRSRRREYVTQISRMVTGEHNALTKLSEEKYQLDASGDWMLELVPEEPEKIRISFRWTGDLERTFCHWLALKWNASGMSEAE